MLVEDFFHMNSDNEECSYANNSFIQETMIRKAQPLLKEIIKGIANVDGFPHCFNIADLGCSTGPNTILFVSNIINEVQEVCKEKNLEVPQVQVCLNDLFGNDYNSIFKSLPMFYAKHSKDKSEKYGQCFISAVPGTFYGRLFPNQSMHFFHSSNSLHWLSQVPRGLENNGLNIYMAKTSPPNVFENYRMQFQKDFTTFLESRSHEIIRGGHMVFTMVGRSDVDPTCNDSGCFWELLAKSLADTAKDGLIGESEIITFNIPLYTPYKDELIEIIHNQGSFCLDTNESFEVNWDPYDTDYESMKACDEPNHGKTAAKILRAVIEPMLVTHFGNLSMDLVFQKFEKYVDKYLSVEKTKHYFIVISMTRI